MGKSVHGTRSDSLCDRFRMRGENNMKTGMIQISSAQLAYALYGDGKVGIVIEMGLGASMAEWNQLAKRLSGQKTVLLYQRAGYGASSVSTLERTPGNIAMELRQLLEQIPHEEKVVLLAHSQGGLYAWKFAKMYPELVSRLVLLDPLSPEDYRFRTELTEDEFKKSGADKTEGLRLNLKLTRFHLGWMVKKAMAGAPPFYYYDGFSREERRDILSSLGRAQTYRTALVEYDGGHDMQELAGLLDKTEKLSIPVTLVTHDSDISCREIREFGGASEEEARTIEALWQEIMRAYLTCTACGELTRAAHSSHYIHLTDPDLICKLL